MRLRQRIGIILMIVGIAIPVVLFGFTEGYDKDHGFFVSINRMKITIKETTFSCKEWDTLEMKNISTGETTTVGDRYCKDKEIHEGTFLQYKHLFAIGIILIIVGLYTTLIRKEVKKTLVLHLVFSVKLRKIKDKFPHKDILYM